MESEHPIIRTPIITAMTTHQDFVLIAMNDNTLWRAHWQYETNTFTYYRLNNPPRS